MKNLMSEEMDHDAFISLAWKTIEGDCSLAEIQKLEQLVDADPLWEAVYRGLVATYKEGGHIDIVAQRLLKSRTSRTSIPQHAAQPASISAPAMTHPTHFDRSILRLLSFNFAIVALLAIVGIGLTWKSWHISPARELPVFASQESPVFLSNKPHLLPAQLRLAKLFM